MGEARRTRMADTEAQDQAIEQAEKKKEKKVYRKDKPWDNDSIDHWKINEWTEDDAKASSHFLEESSFATLFPQYREKYLREGWAEGTRGLDKHGIACELDCVEGSMMVKTTRKTRDPFIIFKARDLIKLLSRNKERFVKRRQRLLGPNGSTLKAIELLTECYMLVQGRTVSLIGEHKGLKSARKIVEDCMHNIHPIYNIKELMIKRELAKDETLKGENWDRFLPQFKQRAAKKKKKKEGTTKKPSYNPFPPEQMPRKIDQQLESGEYFLGEDTKRRMKEEEREVKQEQAAVKQAKKRRKAFKEPAELPVASSKGGAEAPQEKAGDLAERVKKKLKSSK